MKAVDKQTAYRVDVLAEQPVLPDEAYALKAMLLQAEQIRGALASNEPWRNLLSEFPGLIGIDEVLGQEKPFSAMRARIIEMYSRYVEEWRSVPIELVNICLNFSDKRSM